MPGYELVGKEEKQALMDLFDADRVVLFAHGFDAVRKGVYKVREFEKKAAEYFRCRNVQAVSSGTAALLVSLKSMGIKPGDEVITSSFTFVATAEAIIAAGAVPVMTEIDDTFNMDPLDLEAKITPKTKAIIPVHMAGTACSMERILEIAKKHGLRVLEDVAQSSGTTYHGKFLGTFGDMGIFSLDFAKNFTCGEGGLILTDNDAFFLEARPYHDHGHEYNKALPRGKDSRHAGGFNYRMSEMQAAVGIVQLGKLSFIVETQRKNKAYIKSRLNKNLRFRKVLNPQEESGDTLIFSLESKDRALEFAKQLGENGLGTKNLPDAIDWHFAGTWAHLLGHYPGMERPEMLWPRSKSLLERSIAIPVNVNMPESEKNKIVEVINKLSR
jgi:8-amino-3,8-dideoxy-alpha-D-manno-octulosonate transaminase